MFGMFFPARVIEILVEGWGTRVVLNRGGEWAGLYHEYTLSCFKDRCGGHPRGMVARSPLQRLVGVSEGSNTL